MLYPFKSAPNDDLDAEGGGPYHKTPIHWRTKNFANLLPLTEELFNCKEIYFHEYPLSRLMLFGCTSTCIFIYMYSIYREVIDSQDHLRCSCF